jgi:hypothetical protein
MMDMPSFLNAEFIVVCGLLSDLPGTKVRSAVVQYENFHIRRVQSCVIGNLSGYSVAI